MAVAFDADRDAILAVDIDGSRFEAGIVTPAGSLIDRSSIAPEIDVGPQSHFASVASVVTEQLERSGQHGRRIKALPGFLS